MIRERMRKKIRKQENLILKFKKREVTELQDLTPEGVKLYMKLLSNPEYFAIFNGVKYILGRQFHHLADKELVVKHAIKIADHMLVVEAVPVVQTMTIIQTDNSIILNGQSMSMRDIPKYLERYIK